MSELFELVKECAEKAKTLVQKLALQGNFEPLYLYYQESVPGKMGRLILVPESESAPSGTKLASSEPLRGNIAYENYFQWVFDRSTRLPVLPY